MKKYEKLNLTVETLSSDDIITTSKAVTTEDINVPWASAYETN